MKKKIRFLPKRRKQKGKTDYGKRLKMLKSEKPRVTIRKSLNNLIIQLILYDPKGDKILISTSSKQLEKLGWRGHKGNIPAAYLTGLLFGTKIKDKVKEVISDLGLYRLTKGCVIYAALKGVIDAGIKIPHGEGIFPPEDKIHGRGIENYAKNIDKSKYEKQFSKHLKNGIKPEELSKHFEEIKNKIIKG